MQNIENLSVFDYWKITNSLSKKPLSYFEAFFPIIINKLPQSRGYYAKREGQYANFKNDASIDAY